MPKFSEKEYSKMNEPIEIFSSKLKSVEKVDLLNAIDNLNAHMKNKTYFKPYTFSINKNTNIKEDFSSKNKRQSYFYDCIFEECNFFEASFAGSIFVKCDFINCMFDFSKFQSCDFRSCNLIFSGNDMKEIHSVNFSKSVLFDCKLVNLFLNSANMGETVFDNVEIINNKWRSVLVENMIIKNSILRDMRFASQNFDFLTIENLKTYNTIIPFPALPYIINGLTYLYKTADEISFTSCNSKNNRISKSEYIRLIDDFEIYYTYVNEYFPLANIMIAQERLNDAIYVTYLGIIQSLKLKNFRMIYQFCKLVQINPKFTIQYKKRLYQQIQLEIDKEELSKEDYKILNVYLGKIKDILLNTTITPQLVLDIKTNIDSTEINKIPIFIQEIEKLIFLYMKENEEHFIEIHHNSLENFIIQITADPEQLIIFLAAFFTCIGYSSQFVAYLFKKAKDLFLKKTNSTVENSEFDVQNAQFTYTKKKFEDNGIVIVNVNYNIFNAPVIDSTIQSGYVDLKDL